MLKIENLYKSFGDRQIFSNITLTVKQGDVVVLIGPSGAGKSTLLRCINFLEQPDSGSISIDNKKIDVSKPSAQDIMYLRQNTSMVFQHYNLFRNKTAIENVMEALVTVHKMAKDKAEQIALECLENVDMLSRKNNYPSTLSGGQQQRVGIARAMAVKPKVLLFDEPTSSLDPELVDEILSVIQKLAEQKHTMVLVTHELAFAREVADHIIFLNEGAIYEENTASEFFSNPQKERTKQFISSLYRDSL